MQFMVLEAYKSAIPNGSGMLSLRTCQDHDVPRRRRTALRRHVMDDVHRGHQLYRITILDHPLVTGIIHYPGLQAVVEHNSSSPLRA